MVAACWMAKGQSSGVIVLSHFEIAWLSIDRAVAQSVPCDRSTRPFCHCELTPLKFIFCFLWFFFFFVIFYCFVLSCVYASLLISCVVLREAHHVWFVFLVLLFLIVEVWTVSVVITTWTARTARLGVGAISRVLSSAIISCSFVLVVITIVIAVRALVTIVPIAGRLLWRAVMVLLCLFVLFVHFRHLCVFIVLPANSFVMELIMMAVAFLAPEGW
jgi:hypothetical protein